MISAPVFPDEEERLAALRAYSILDTPFEKDYDDLCRLAATICEVPIALISFVDRDRTWFKSKFGMDDREASRDLAFCSHAIWHDGIFEVPDASQDDRFFDNPLVTGSRNIRFYAGQALRGSDGHPLGTLCTLDQVPRQLDDRQRVALEILARQVVAQLELRRTARNLAQANDDKDRFFSVIAHDLRSPFSGVLGLADLMKVHGASMDRAEIDKYIGMLHQGLYSFYRFSENLLKWTMLERGKMSFVPEKISVGELVDEALGPLRDTLALKKQVVDVDVSRDVSLVGDRNMLASALRNMLSNASKFTNDRGRICIEAKVRQGVWRISVIDAGTGMDPNVLDVLRNGRRVGSKNGTAGEAGTGLGLGLVRMFAEKHQGTLEFDSVPDQGTTVTLVLPQLKTDEPATQPVDQQS